jgi:hypothetical protein
VETACAHTERKVFARSMCKSCYHRWLMDHNPEFAQRHRARQRQNYRENREAKIAYVKKWQRDNPNKLKQYALKRLYGLTPEQYQAMLEAQGGTCAICDEQMRRPHIDHDHQTGQVRALLCARCNTGLALLEDPARRAAAEEYLSKFYAYKW